MSITEPTPTEYQTTGIISASSYVSVGFYSTRYDATEYTLTYRTCGAEIITVEPEDINLTD